MKSLDLPKLRISRVVGKSRQSLDFLPLLTKRQFFIAGTEYMEQEMEGEKKAMTQIKYYVTCVPLSIAD